MYRKGVPQEGQSVRQDNVNHKGEYTVIVSKKGDAGLIGTACGLVRSHTLVFAFAMFVLCLLFVPSFLPQIRKVTWILLAELCKTQERIITIGNRQTN